MSNNIDIKPITKKEQLEWVKGFLEKQIFIYQEELKECNRKLEEIKVKKLVKEINDE